MNLENLDAADLVVVAMIWTATLVLTGSFVITTVKTVARVWRRR